MNSDYSIYKNHIIELFENDIENYNRNKNFHTLYCINSLMDHDNVNLTINDISIEVMNFSVRTYCCLKRAEINTVSDILKLDFEQLLKIRNIGNKSIDEVLRKLYELITTNYSFDDFNIEDYPLITSIKNINPAKNTKEHIDISIQSFFDANLSPGLINILLMHGYTNFRNIILDSKNIINILKHYPKDYVTEFQYILEKFTNVSVIVSLDIKLLNFISTYNISNLKELIECFDKIEEKDFKDKVQRIIKAIEEYDCSIINKYMFVSHNEVSSKVNLNENFDVNQ